MMGSTLQVSGHLDIPWGWSQSSLAPPAVLGSQKTPVVPSLLDGNLSVKFLDRGARLGAGLEPGTIGRIDISQA